MRNTFNLKVPRKYISDKPKPVFSQMIIQKVDLKLEDDEQEFDFYHDGKKVEGRVAQILDAAILDV